MFAHTAAREAVQWLVEMGLVHRNHMDQFMHRVRAMNVVLYGGASLPLGNYAHTLLHTRMVLLWLLWDDVIVEKMPADAAEHILYVNHIAQMDNIMHGHVVIDPMINLITVHDRFAYAWQDIMQTIMQHNYISAEYVQRFGDAFVEWIKYANEEKMQQQHNHQQQQLQHYGTSNNDSTIIDTDKARQRDEQWEAYVTQRKKTIGMVNTALLLEIAVGFSIPSDIWRSAPCQRIIDLSALLVGLGNELASLAKDIRHFQNISATGSTTATTHTITTDSPMSADATTTSSSTTAASSPAIQDACWTNLILIYSQLYHVRFDEAVNHILTQHNNAVQEFDNVVENWLTLHRHHRPQQQQQQQRQEHAHANTGDPSEHTNEAITDHDQALKHHTHSNDDVDGNVGERPMTASPDQSSMCSTSSYMIQWNERLRAFVQYLRYCVYGFAHWHTSTERYMSHCAVDHHTRSVYRIHCS